MESQLLAMRQRVKALEAHSTLGLEMGHPDETLQERVARLERLAVRIQRGEMRFKPGYAEM